MGDSTDNKSDLIQKNFDSIHWLWHRSKRASDGNGRGVVANPNFLTVEKLSTIFSPESVCRKMPNLGPELSFCGNFGEKVKYWAPIIFSVNNLQLSVGILSKRWSISGKIATSDPAYFLDPRCHCSLVIAIWTNSIVLSHCSTIVGRSTQKN